MDPEIVAAAAATAPGDGARTRRPDTAFVGDNANGPRKASSPPSTSTTATTSSSSSSFSAHHLLLAFLLGALLPLFSFPILPVILEKLIPPLTPSTLPPNVSLQPAIKLVAAADALSRALTPPNLRVLKEVTGLWHSAQVRTAAELRLADFLVEEEERARRECLLSMSSSRSGGARRGPSLARKLSCSLRLRFLSLPSMSSRQLAKLAVPGCKAAEEARHASEAAAFAEGSVLPRTLPLAGCEGVARRVERLLRALSAYGFFEAVTASSARGSTGKEEAEANDDPILSTRWRNSRASRFLASSHPHSLRAAVLLMAREGLWGAWGRLPLAIATGRPGFIDPGRMGQKGDAAAEALLANGGGGGGSGVCHSTNSSSSASLSPSSSNDDGKYHPPDDYWHYLESDASGRRALTFDAAMVELNRASASARAVAEDAPFATLWANLDRRRRQQQQQLSWRDGDGDGSAGYQNGREFSVDVIDVGGGAGELAAEVLRRHSGVVGRAVVVDLPRAVGRARRAWACAAANSSSSDCPTSLLSLAPHAQTFPANLRERISFSEGTMFSSKSLSAAVEKGLGSFAEEKEGEESEKGADPSGRRRIRKKRQKSPRRVQSRRRRLFLLRDVIHDWGDAETVKIFTALRKSMGSAEEDDEHDKIGDDGRGVSHHHRFPSHDRDDRVLIVGRSPSEKPLRGPLAFVESKGAQDADLLMLACFGGGGAGSGREGKLGFFWRARGWS